MFAMFGHRTYKRNPSKYYTSINIGGGPYIEYSRIFSVLMVTTGWTTDIEISEICRLQSALGFKK